MTATLLDSAARVFADVPPSAPSSGGRITLEERLQGAWRRLHLDGAAECPVCRGEMTLQGGTGDCRGCGAKMR